MKCKIDPDGVERNQPGVTSSEMQHQSQYEIDISTNKYQDYLQTLANYVYSMACFHGKYKHEPGFSQDCKKTVERLYGKKAIRLKRHQIEKLKSNVCDMRRIMESSPSRRPQWMNSKNDEDRNGEDHWNRIVERHRCAEDALKYWLQDRWLPVEGDEQQRNARWWNNRKYEEPLEDDQKDQKGGAGPMQIFQSAWDILQRYMPWGKGGKGRPVPAPRRPARIPLRRGPWK